MSEERPYQPHKSSLDAYAYIKAGGKINERQVKVFNVFVHGGPLSAKMMHNRYCKAYGKINVDCVAPRIRELKETGMLVALEKSRCSVTGNVVEFSRAAEPGEAVEIPLSTKQETKKVLETSLRLVRLWRHGGLQEKKVEALEEMELLLGHFYPDEIGSL